MGAEPGSGGIAAGRDELLRVDPPLVPPHRCDLVFDEGDQVLAVGVVLLAEEEGALIHAVDGAIAGKLCADDRRQGREEVVDGDHLGALSSWDPARPLDHARDPDRALESIAELTPEGAVVAAAIGRRSADRGRRVVGDPDHDGVVLDPRRRNGVEHLAGAIVELHDRVAVGTDARPALELGRHQARIVGVGPADEHEEGRLRLGLTLDEVDGCRGDVTLDLVAVVHGVLTDRLEIAVGFGLVDPRHDLLDEGLGHAAAFHALPVQGAVGGLDDPHVVLVEPLTRRPALLLEAEVPFARIGRGVALALEELGERHLGRLQGVWCAADDDGVQTHASRVAPGQQRRPGWRAPRLDEELGQLQAFVGDGVDAGCGHAADLTAAVGADVAPSDIVGQHENHVGFFGRRNRVGQQDRHQDGQREDVERSWFHADLRKRYSESTASAAIPGFEFRWEPIHTFIMPSRIRRRIPRIEGEMRGKWGGRGQDA